MLLAACASPTGSQGGDVQQEGNQAQTDLLVGDGEAGAQLEITAGPEGQAKDPLEAGEAGGLISSSGKTVEAITPEPEQDGMVQLGGSSGGAAGEDDLISSEDLKWSTYTDEKYGFSIDFPEGYVILPEGGPAEKNLPEPLSTIRFQDEEIAKSEMADLEPPKFLIEIFERPASPSLHDWLQSKTLAPQNAEVETVELAGAQEGLKVSLKIMLAPNVFYYFATEQYIYRLVPLGAYAEEMLATFKLPAT
jgi:hypothetical protein